MLRSFSHTPFYLFAEFSLPRCGVKSNEFLLLYFISWCFMLFYVVFITICMENPNYAIFVDESLSTNIQHSLTMGSSLDILELLTIPPVNIFCRNDPLSFSANPKNSPAGSPVGLRYCLLLFLSLYGVIQILQALVPSFHQIRNGDSVHYLVHCIIQFLPYLQSLTGITSFADISAFLQTCHRSQ